MTLFCKYCGIELDRDDVDANLNSFDVFLLCCSDCVEVEVGRCKDEHA